MSRETLWIFGYGSLVWRPAFSHLRRRRAFIEGYARRFWQGSTDHRGVPGQPGRVVTLLPHHDEHVANEPDFQPERCWGTAYEVPLSDPDGVLASLDHRERGGYERLELELRFEGEECAPGLVYVAGPSNDNYLGPAPLDEIATQVAGAVGPSGANPEYVFELARSLRAMGAHDQHVFGVARALDVILGASARPTLSPGEAER